MNQQYSKLTSKSQTVIPREVRQRLGVKPGDMLRYTVTNHGVVIDKVSSAAVDNPFALFIEWSSAADDKAYGKL